EPFRPPLVSDDYRQSMNRGKVLFTVTGCAACHSEPAAQKAARNDEDEKDPLRPEDSFHAAGTPNGPAAKYTLGAVGSKYRPDTLAAFLQNPLKTPPSGRMPNMNLSGQEATDLARYLCRLTDETFGPSMPTAPWWLKPSRIAEKVFADSDALAFKFLSAD